MKVLIVDGCKQTRRDMVEALAQLTNVVVQGAVANVRTALHALADASPDLVVTDAGLPDDEGAQLVAKIRRLERAPSIVVVAAAGSDEERARYLAAGADRYVERDAELRELQDAVITLGRGRVTAPANDTLRLLGRLTSGVAHDFNNYLCAIDGLLGLAQRRADDTKVWEQLRQAVETMVRLNATLLVYARGETPARELVDMTTVVRDVLATFSKIVPANVQMTTELADGVRPVQGVRAELEQLVLNLVINACDAMADGGALHVAVSRTAAAAVHLRIADSGTGIDLRGSRQSRGLGLGIVHGVVERHRGAIQFAPRTGGGTVVDIMLPAQ